MESPGQPGRAPPWTISAFRASEPTIPAAGCHQGRFRKPQPSSTSQKAKAERPRMRNARSAAGASGRRPGVEHRASITPAAERISSAANQTCISGP